MANTKTVSLNILGKPLQLSCPEGEESSLYRSARYLSEKINTVKESNRTLDKERIAIIAALNITHELTQLEEKMGEEKDTSTQQLLQIINRIDETMKEVQS